MPFATVITAVVAFIVGAALGWWPLAAWTQHSTKGERMPLRTVRIAGAAITAVTFAALALRFGPTWILPALLVFAAASTVLTLVDLAEKRLPNAVIFPTLAAVGVLLVPPTWAAGSWIVALWALAGSAAMFAVYFVLALISPKSMGMGDVKLALVIGLLLGWFGLNAWLIGLLAAFIVGGRDRDRGVAAAPRHAEGLDPVRAVDARGGIDRVARRRRIAGSGYTRVPPERGTAARRTRPEIRASRPGCALNGLHPQMGHRFSCTAHGYLQSPPVPAGGVPSCYPKETAMLKAYSRAVARINSLRTEEEGATATEYALVLGLVAIALVVAAIALTPILNTLRGRDRHLDGRPGRGLSHRIKRSEQGFGMPLASRTPSE